MDKAIVLMYHNIGIPQGRGSFRTLYVAPSMFRFQMWYLKTAGFRVVPLREILSFIGGGTPEERVVAITFDDGYQDFYDNAYPVLKAYNFPSTVFLVSGLIGKENLWDYGKGDAEKKLLDWDKINQIKKDVSFGSHTITHPFLTSLKQEEMESEVRNSKSRLEERLQLPVDFFCYPYGDYDDRAAVAVEKAGYMGAVTTDRGLVHRDDNPYKIRRSSITCNTHPLLFIYRLHSTYDDRKGQRR